MLRHRLVRGTQVVYVQAINLLDGEHRCKLRVEHYMEQPAYGRGARSGASLGSCTPPLSAHGITGRGWDGMGWDV